MPLGLVVVGGVFFSTFLTLLLVPVMYTLLARFTKVTRSAGDKEEARAGEAVRPEMAPAAGESA